MTVQGLIEALSKLPPDAEVSHAWDGAARGTVDKVWLARSGEVVLAADYEILYDPQDRPATQ